MRRNGKRSLIAGIIALSMILMGTGYAYWTDGLNVTAKATTGELAVTFVDLGLYAQYGNETMTDGWSIVDGIERTGTPGYVEDEFFARGSGNYNAIAKAGSIDAYTEKATEYNHVTFDATLDGAKQLGRQVGPYRVDTNSSDKITISVDNIYPGYAQAFRTDIINTGTLAAQLSNISFDVASNAGKQLNDETKGLLGVAVLIDTEAYNPPEGTENVFQLAKLVGAENCFTIGGVDFVRLSALDDFGQAIADAELLAYPGSDNRMDLFLAVGMDPDAAGEYTTGTAAEMNTENRDAKSQNAGAKVSLKMAWGQFNEGSETGNPNWLAHQNAE